MELELFLADVERKPATLAELADRCAGGVDWGIDLASVERVVLLGMGSSRYAAEYCARSLRAQGIPAWADYSSAFSDHIFDANTLVVLISASGSTPETLAAAESVRDRGLTLALTNSPASALESTREGQHRRGRRRRVVGCRDPIDGSHDRRAAGALERTDG